MMIEFQVFLLLGSCDPGGDHTRTRDVLRCGTNVCRRPSAWSGLGLGTRVGGLCMLLPGRSGSLRSSWRVRNLHSAQSRRSYLSDLAWVKTWTEATIVDPVGVEIVGVGQAFWRRHYCRGAEPEDDAIFLAFTPHLLTKPPKSPGSSSSFKNAANVIATHWAATA